MGEAPLCTYRGIDPQGVVPTKTGSVLLVLHVPDAVVLLDEILDAGLGAGTTGHQQDDEKESSHRGIVAWRRAIVKLGGVGGKERKLK